MEIASLGTFYKIQHVLTFKQEFDCDGHTKRYDYMTENQKEKYSVEKLPKVIQILQLEGKDFKTTVIHLFKKMEGKRKKIDEIMENFTR